MNRRLSKILLLSSGCLLLLSGCSWLGDWPPGGKQSKAPYPEDIKVTSAEPAAPVEAPPESAVRAIPPGDTNARLTALESEVQDLRNDLSTMMPALTKLATAQEDLGRVLAAMAPAAGTMTPQNAPAPAAAAAAPPQSLQPLTPDMPGDVVSDSARREEAQEQDIASLAAEEPSAPPVAEMPENSPAVFNVRLGEHGDKTRVVLDVSDNVAFSYDLGNDGSRLTIDLPGTRWEAADVQEFGASPMVASYQVVPGEQGTQVVFQLRQPSQVVWAQALEASEEKETRVVIDLSR